MKKHRGMAVYLCLCVSLLLLLRWSLQEVPGPEPPPAISGPVRSLTIEEFRELLAGQPLAVTSSSYVVRDDKYKAMFPDMLRAVMRNNTEEEVTDAAVAFAAWDMYGAPVAIEGKRDLPNGEYVRVVNYEDLDLLPGETGGEDLGYSVEDGRGIQRVEAVAVSYTTASGRTWENPYYPQWAALYGGRSYTEMGTVEVPDL